jgi:Rod binding domain-containing protein
MSAPVTLGAVPRVALGPPAARPPETVEAAAKQFEALMIAQLLKEARGDEDGWLGSGEDAGSATQAGLAEEQFAQALARNGGLGLSAQIVSSLAARAK